PFSLSRSEVSAMPFKPPIPEPMRTPVRSCLSCVSAFQPASSRACVAAAMEKMMKSSTLRWSLGSIQSSALNMPSARDPRGTKQPIWQERSETSNSSMRRAPLRPASRRDQLASMPHPSGVTRPSPVMTTRRSMLTPELYCCCSVARPRIRAQREARSARASGGVGMLLEKLHGVTDRLDLLGRVVGDLAAELLLERHH